MTDAQRDSQRAFSDCVYNTCHQTDELLPDPVVRYLVQWRLRSAMERLLKTRPEIQTWDQLSVASICCGAGLEGSLLIDAGLIPVFVSDLSAKGVRAAITRDHRLMGFAADAEELPLANNSVDLVVVQDGLHHLRSPVRGFTEMLRTARIAACFLEPHDSLSGRLLGKRWETHGDAVNYVFRWNRRLVDSVAGSYLGPDGFENCSFSFWHHNVVLGRLGDALGGGPRAVGLLKVLKNASDAVASGLGNQFCGLVVKTRA
jgi:Methyltransferase domain